MKKYKFGFYIRLIICVLVYGCIWWGIDKKIDKDFGHLASQLSDVEASMDAYLNNIKFILLAAIVINIFWLIIAYSKIEIRKWYEENTFACVIISSLILLAVIIFRDNVNSGVNGGIIDDSGNKQVLCYSYCVLSGLLFNLFVYPPQTVSDVILPGGRKTEILFSVISAFMAIIILMR